MLYEETPSAISGVPELFVELAEKGLGGGVEH